MTQSKDAQLAYPLLSPFNLITFRAAWPCARRAEVGRRAYRSNNVRPGTHAVCSARAAHAMASEGS